MLTVRKLLLASAITVVASQAWAIDVTGTWLMSVQTLRGLALRASPSSEAVKSSPETTRGKRARPR